MYPNPDRYPIALIAKFCAQPNWTKLMTKLENLPKYKVLRIGYAWCGNP